MPHALQKCSIFSVTSFVVSGNEIKSHVTSKCGRTADVLNPSIREGNFRQSKLVYAELLIWQPYYQFCLQRTLYRPNCTMR